MVVMCDSKFKFISIVKPKYLTLFDCEMVVSFKIIFVCGNGLFSLAGMIKKLDLEELIVRLFVSNHKESFSRSSFMFRVKLDKVRLDIIKQVSSAKSLGTHLTDCGISLTYKRNKRGPTIEP